MPEFVIIKGLFGGYTVRYSCASCGERLCSPLIEAGNPVTCTKCQCVFTVPADVIRQQIDAKMNADAQRAAQKDGGDWP